jgi:hypothetical protein
MFGVCQISLLPSKVAVILSKYVGVFFGPNYLSGGGPEAEIYIKMKTKGRQKYFKR